MTSHYNLLLLIPVICMVVQDFRSREVGLLWLILLCAGSLCSAFLTMGIRDTLYNLSLNALLILYMIGGAGLWFFLKNKVLKNSATGRRKASEYIGGGDIVFVMAVSPLFLLKEYVIFLIVSSVISLVWWMIAKIRAKTNLTIPFIGTSGIVFCVLLLSDIIWI